jgi:phage terminase large subunit-like protein
MPTTLLDALDDGAFFGTHFPPSWNAWRAFCRALYGLPMPGYQLATFTACTGRQRAPTTPASEAWVICGRRSGKSRIAAAIASYIAALAPTTTLGPGEWGTVLVCAVDKQQARVVFDYIKALFGLPALRPLVARETAEGIELRHRVRLEVRASNFRSVRGVTLLGAVVDELAFLRDEASAAPDVEL